MNEGRFHWKRRMGEHEAYHMGLTNKIIHWICIPFELWGVIKILSLVKVIDHPSLPLDLGLISIFLLSFIYFATDFFLGLAMVLFLLCLWKLAAFFPGDFVLGFIAGGIAFGVAFTIQTQIGHKKFEEDGRDDTEKNIQELRSTLNPIPLFLIFYYHLVEIFFILGFREKLKTEILCFRDHYIFQKLKTCSSPHSDSL